MSPSQTTLHTVGDVARLLDVPIHRVEYILRTRPQVQPVGRIGIARVYDGEAVDLVRQALSQVATRQQATSDATEGGK